LEINNNKILNNLKNQLVAFPNNGLQWGNEVKGILKFGLNWNCWFPKRNKKWASNQNWKPK